MTFYLYILASRSIIFESESQCFEFASISSLCISSLFMTLDKQLIADQYHINDSHFQLQPKGNGQKFGEIKLTFECFILIAWTKLNIHDFSTCDMSKTNTFPLWMINCKHAFIHTFKPTWRSFYIKGTRLSTFPVQQWTDQVYTMYSGNSISGQTMATLRR